MKTPWHSGYYATGEERSRRSELPRGGQCGYFGSNSYRTSHAMVWPGFRNVFC